MAAEMPALRGAGPILSLALALILAVVYLIRADITYAITIWPAWVWMFIGVPIALLFRSGRRRRAVAIVLGGWLLFTLVFSEEWKSGLRSVLPKAEAEVRIISVNCAMGDYRVAQEALALNPDILLLQETPGVATIERATGPLSELGYSSYTGVDTSILARGRIYPIELPRGAFDYVAAVVQLENGDEYFVVSLRLNPPLVRMDYWNPATWQAYAENRRDRKAQLRRITNHVMELFIETPMIIGGDFNTPPDERILGIMRLRLRDSFESAGRGWGATALNDLPMVRIDQIWVSDEIRPVSVRARKTMYSDHRMVICDVLSEGD